MMINSRLRVFGCSFTFGVGVPIGHTWPELFCHSLEKQIAAPVNNFNLGFGGVSADFICRTLYCAVPVLKPDLVLILLPNMYRREKHISSGHAQLMSPHADYDIAYYEKYANYYSAKNNFLKNLMFMKTFLELHNIPWLFSTWDEDMKKERADDKNYAGEFSHYANDKARDGSHPSIQSYTHLSSLFLKKYNELYT